DIDVPCLGYHLESQRSVLFVQSGQRGKQDVAHHPRRRADADDSGSLHVGTRRHALDLVDLELDALGPAHDEVSGRVSRKEPFSRSNRLTPNALSTVAMRREIVVASTFSRSAARASRPARASAITYERSAQFFGCIFAEFRSIFEHGPAL